MLHPAISVGLLNVFRVTSTNSSEWNNARLPCVPSTETRAFVPVVPCNLPEETEVEVVVREEPCVLPPLESDPKERRKNQTRS